MAVIGGSMEGYNIAINSYGMGVIDNIKWDRRKRYGVADAHPLHAGAGCRKSSALMLSIIIAASGCAEREDMALRLLSMMALRPLFMSADPAQQEGN